MSTTEVDRPPPDKEPFILHMYSPDTANQPEMTTNANTLNVNHADVWPKLARSVVEEVCSNAVQYTPVPELSEDGESFLPLQVFTDKTTLSSNALIRLGRTQKRLPTDYVVKVNWWRRLWHRAPDDIESSCHDVTFDGATDWLDSPVSCSIEQKKVHTKYFPERDENVSYSSNFSISAKDVYIRRVDPKKLHDVVFPARSPITQMKLRSFHFIYETYVAREIVCAVCVSHGGKETLKTAVIRNTPIAFRYVEATLDCINRVKSLQWDTKNANRQCDNQYVVIQSQRIIQFTD